MFCNKHLVKNALSMQIKKLLTNVHIHHPQIHLKHGSSRSQGYLVLAIWSVVKHGYDSQPMVPFLYEEVSLD